MSSTRTMTVLIQDQKSQGNLSFSPPVQIINNMDSSLESVPNLFILTSATHLNNVSSLVRNTNQKHHLRVLFIREDINPSWLPQILERANLRTLRNTLSYQDSESNIPQRVINAWSWGAQDQLIAKATVLGDRLLVLSCGMEKFEVAFADLPCLKNIPTAERGNFTISEEGSYLYWEKQDIHLDLDALRCVINPQIKAKFDAQRLTHDVLFGKAIAALRKQHKLKQSDIIGLSERQVSRIEKGEGTKVATLQLFAQAHKMELNDYLAAVGNLVSGIPDDFLSNDYDTDFSVNKPLLKDKLRQIMGNETIEVISSSSNSDCLGMEE